MEKLKTALILIAYIGVTIGLYALICHFNHRPFGDIEFVYAALIGCIAYFPRFLARKKSQKK